MNKIAIWFAAALTAAIVFGGCATVATPANATLGQKAIADAVALKQVANDVKSKCGPELAPIAPLIAAALSVATDPYNAMGDVVAALQMIPVLAQDYKAFACVVTTIRDDYNALKPAKATSRASAAMP